MLVPFFHFTGKSMLPKRERRHDEDLFVAAGVKGIKVRGNGWIGIKYETVPSGTTEGTILRHIFLYGAYYNKEINHSLLVSSLSPVTRYPPP